MIPARFQPLVALCAIAAFIAPPLAALSELRVSQDALPDAIVGSAYSYALSAKGGASGYTYACTGGCVVPPGLALSSGGVISGTPTVAGLFTMPLDVYDVQGARATNTVTLEILRAEAVDKWCPRGKQGGPFTAVAVDPSFATNGKAVAASSQGGAMTSSDGGQSWTTVSGFGQYRVAEIVMDWCPGSNNPTWGVTFPGGSFAELTGAILRNVGGTPSWEIQNPAGWTGSIRHIKQAYHTCDGSMLASDNAGGILWRTSGLTGTWSAANGGLPQVAGGYPVNDIAYGYAGAPTTAFALVNDNGTGSAAIYRATALPTGGWTSCPAVGQSAEIWIALGVTPDGLALAASRKGSLVWYNTALACSVGSSPTAAPPLRDNGVTVTPEIRGFAFDGCYTSGASGNRGVYAYTSAGIFYSADPFDGANAKPFDKLSKGLLSESVTDLAVSPSCSDRRLVAAVERRGVHYGDANGFCAARLGGGDTVDLVGLAAADGFTNRTGACTAPPVDGLHAAGRASGLSRGALRTFIAAGETREQAFLDIAAGVSAGTQLHASTASGVYVSSDLGLSYPAFYPTDEPITRLAESSTAPNGHVFGIGTKGVYAGMTATPWSLLLQYPAVAGAVAYDLAPGATQYSLPSLNDDAMWVAFGSGGVLELSTRLGTPTFVQSTVGGGTVRRIGASQMIGQPNYVFIQGQGPTGGYVFQRGTKAASPLATVTFATLGSSTSLPNEIATQIVVEPTININGNQGDLFILYPNGGLFRSTDLGGSFASLGIALPPQSRPLRLVLARDYDSAQGRRRLAVLVDGKGVYQSNDGGTTFCGPSPVGQLPVELNSIATNDNNRLFAGHDFGVSASYDRGINWMSRPFGNRPVYAILTRAGTNDVLAGAADGIWRSLDEGNSWTRVYASALPVTGFTQTSSGMQIAAAMPGGGVLLSGNGGASFTAQASPSDVKALDYNASTAFAAGATAAYWTAGSSTGASWSATGASWTAANGGNADYTLSLTGSWQSVATLGGSPSRVLVGNSTLGLWRTLDGGDTWRKVSSTGSGLEATSQNASSLMTTSTSYGDTDVLVGMTGSLNGGVYLSGDRGEHWTQVNQGYDPASLSISTLVKTSCSGCPVQYYSGSYGGGMYTRTITVVASPTVTGGCWGSTGCSCAAGAGSGAEQGGQAFKLCGTGFQNGLVVEFDGVAASGCAYVNATTLTCTGTPPHYPGAAAIRVRNPDTRMGAGPAYTYTSGTPRIPSVTVAKSGSNAVLTYACGSACASVPARVWRSQNAPFTQYVEQFAGSSTTYTDTGALAVGAYGSYFWTVE